MDTMTGSVVSCYNAWSKDPAIRHISASGGVITSIIYKLLGNGYYDGAFCLDSFDYRSQLKPRLFSVEDIASTLFRTNTPKSRYLPVSHEDTISYIKQHRDARLILVGTSCAIRGLQAAIQALRLDRDQYLLIGLFCDMVYNYNILTYYENQLGEGTTLQGIHFKNKEGGGWPGDMKMFPVQGAPFFVSCTERVRTKPYFVQERCIYCVDKLNVYADISVGDNYTGINESKLGSNSVIIRTRIGNEAWNAVKDELEICDVDISDIQKAQYLQDRANNVYLSDLKSQYSHIWDLNPGVQRSRNSSDYLPVWKKRCKQLYSGAVYDTQPGIVSTQIRKDTRKKNPIVSFVCRGFRYIKRYYLRKRL